MNKLLCKYFGKKIVEMSASEKVIFVFIVSLRCTSSNRWSDYGGNDPLHPPDYEAMFDKRPTVPPMDNPEAAVSIVLHTTGAYASRSTLYNPKQYEKDDMPKQERTILCQMIKELYMDSYMKVHQSVYLRNVHSPESAYEVGQVSGRLREKYRRMMEVFREMSDKQSRFNRPSRTVIPPKGQGVGTNVRAYLFWAAYEIMHELEWEIEQQIEMVEKVPVEQFRMKPEDLVLQGRDPAGMQEHGDYDDEDVIGSGRRHRADEQRLKRRMRERYLQKTFGQNRQNSSKTLFEKGWPVKDILE